MLNVVVVCSTLLVYTYVGYPLLISALARLAPRRRRIDADYEPKVTACVPAYNVAAYISAKIESLLAQDYPSDKLHVLVYSDGSTDGTDEIVEEYAKRDARVQLVRAPSRQGKPAAVNAMSRLAEGELLLLTDARQPLDQEALGELVRTMSDPEVGCATGNLLLSGPAGSGVYWRYENWIRTQESKFRSVVGMTGPLALVRKAELEPLPSNIILDDVWVPMRLRLRSKRVLLVESAIVRDAAFGDQREFGRKARTLAGNFQIFARMPELFLPWKNPSWLETMSHKLLRLLCPWALVALLLASMHIVLLGAPGLLVYGTVSALLAAQVGLYIAALFGAAAGRIGSVARTFVMMNVAAQVGLWRFLRGRQAVTW
jgi:cellulose synthase/poly-beta-1,6-N-acetylglucosamine synthase-like glycosyltransferase